MPIFESDHNAAGQNGRTPLIAPHTGPGFEYRPRRREGASGAYGNNESFSPAPIPPEVKQQIQNKVDALLAKGQPPDEKLERFWGGFEFIILLFKAGVRLARRKLGIAERDKDDDDDDIADFDQPDSETEEQPDKKDRTGGKRPPFRRDRGGASKSGSKATSKGNKGVDKANASAGNQDDGPGQGKRKKRKRSRKPADASPPKPVAGGSKDGAANRQSGEGAEKQGGQGGRKRRRNRGGSQRRKDKSGSGSPKSE